MQFGIMPFFVDPTQGAVLGLLIQLRGVIAPQDGDGLAQSG
jgi:hypothetical protein